MPRLATLPWLASWQGARTATAGRISTPTSRGMAREEYYYLRGDRRGVWKDRDGVAESRPRGAGLRPLLPHERALRAPRTRPPVGSRQAGRASELGGDLPRLQGYHRLARRRLLRGAHGEVSGRQGDPHRARPPELVRERPQHHLRYAKGRLLLPALLP